MYILLFAWFAVSCLIVLILTYRYNNNSTSDWLKRLSLFVFISPLVLLLIIFAIKQNYYSRVWFYRQDCWFCTGSGPGLLVVIVRLSFMSILGLISYWVLRAVEKTWATDGINWCFSYKGLHLLWLHLEGGWSPTKAFYWPTSQSLIPSLVSKEQLTRANSLIQTTQQFSVVVGPILAGWILVYGSYEGLFFYSAVW